MVPSTSIVPVLLFDSQFFTVLIDVTMKASVLLVLAYLANFTLSGTTSAIRHRFWVTIFGGIFILPILVLSVPAWRLPIFGEVSVIERYESDAKGKGEQTFERSPSAISTSLDINSIPDSNSTNLIADIKQQDLEVTNVLKGNQINRSDLTWWPICVATLWISGIVLGITPILLGVAKQRRVKRESESLDGTEWCELLKNLMAQANMRQKVDILQSSKVSVPIVFGFWRACILLPLESSNWSSQVKRQVLLHELAHVRRWDVALHVFSRVVCSFYWFNPLAWYALRQLRLEREWACDDWVLRMGEPPSTYASNLLEIARASRHHQLRLATEVSMARSKQLEGRLLYILDSNRSRDGINPKSSTILIAVVLLLSVVLAVPNVWGQKQRVVPEGGIGNSTPSDNSGLTKPETLKLDSDVKAEKEDANVGYTDDQKRAIAEVERLGGAITTDATKPGNPVVFVNLSNSQATDDTLALLANLKDLRNLGLFGTKVTAEGIGHLSSLKHLQHIDMTDCNIGDIAMSKIQDLPSIQHLELGRTQVGDEGLRHLANVHKLTQLSLHGTKVTDKGLKYLSGLTNLRTLTLGWTEVSDEGLKHLSKMKKLWTLNLSRTQVHGSGLADLVELNNLVDLNLDETSVNDDCLKHIMRLRSLTSLWLNKTQVTIAGVHELWKVSPKINIQWLETLAEGDASAALKLQKYVMEAKAERTRQAKTSVPPEAKSVMDALRERDQQVKSYRFNWTEEHVEHKGSIRTFFIHKNEIFSTELRPTVATVAEEVKYNWKVELAVDGRRLAYSYSGLRPTFDTDGKALLASQRYRSQFDGKTERSYFQYPNQQKKSQGNMRPGATSSVSPGVYVVPLRFTYSTFSTGMANIDWKKLKGAKNRTIINGHECLAVEQEFKNRETMSNPDFSIIWWLDPDRDYSIVRYTEGNTAGKVIKQIDISSTKDAEYGWIPSKWIIRIFEKGGKVSSTVTATVTNYEINPSFEKNAFQLDFPAGMKIN